MALVGLIDLSLISVISTGCEENFKHENNYFFKIQLRNKYSVNVSIIVIMYCTYILTTSLDLEF